MRPRAAADSGARPRLVCSITPVALITGVSVAAVGGSAATAASATPSGPMAPERASSWAGHRPLDQRRAEHLPRGDQARIGEHDVGAGHVPARVHNRDPNGRCGPRPSRRTRSGHYS